MKEIRDWWAELSAVERLLMVTLWFIIAWLGFTLGLIVVGT